MSEEITGVITDEQLDELEEICRQQAFTCCGNHSIGGEYMGSQELVCCMNPISTELDISWPAESILELLTRLRAAEKDAQRYRWLCESFGVTKLPCAVERILAGDVYVADGKSGVDAAIDAAMERQPLP